MAYNENPSYSPLAGSSSITTLGTVTTGTWNATTIAPTHGGTGVTSATTGDILYASGTNTWANLADVAAGQVLASGGVGTAPAYTATPSVTSITLGGGNALNKYVTASWTPNIQIGGSSTGITYTHQLGYYTQIGNVIFIWMEVVLSSLGGLTGTVSISNLPVATGPTATNQVIPINYYTQVTDAGFTSFCLQIPVSSSSGSFTLSSATGSAVTVMTASQTTNTFEFRANGFYFNA
jgi:hypothetical protein